MSAKHSEQTVSDGVHILQGFQVDDIAARDALVVAATDVGKVVQVDSPISFYLIESQSAGVGTYIRIGGESQTAVRNESGATIVQGKLVAVSGFSVSEAMPLAVLADKDDPAKRPALGFVIKDIPNNSNGSVVILGVLRGVDTSAFSLTDQLVLGTNGDPSRPPPEVDPFTGETQNVGQVVRVDATDGWISVNVGGQIRRFPAGHIFGGQLSPNATNPAFQVDVQRVECRSDDDLMDIVTGTVLTADVTVSGANGLDTGAEAASTWYSVWVIADSTGANAPATLLSTSTTSPTLPSGYDRKRRLGWVRNSSTSDFFDFLQRGESHNRIYRLLEGTDNLVALLNGSATTPTIVSLAAFIPPTSRLAIVNLEIVSSTAGGDGGVRATGTLAGVSRANWPVIIQLGLSNSNEHRQQWLTATDASQQVDYEVQNSGDALDIIVVGFEDVI